METAVRPSAPVRDCLRFLLIMAFSSAMPTRRNNTKIELHWHKTYMNKHVDAVVVVPPLPGLFFDRAAAANRRQQQSTACTGTIDLQGDQMGPQFRET